MDFVQFGVKSVKAVEDVDLAVLKTTTKQDSYLSTYEELFEVI